MAKRKQGEREEEGTGSGLARFAAPGAAPGQGDRSTAGPGQDQAPKWRSHQENAGPGAAGTPSAPGRTGQGYEHTADTKVPSPLLDYRSRFEARYAERTGRHVSRQRAPWASGISGTSSAAISSPSP